MYTRLRLSGYNTESHYPCTIYNVHPTYMYLYIHVYSTACKAGRATDSSFASSGRHMSGPEPSLPRRATRSTTSSKRQRENFTDTSMPGLHGTDTDCAAAPPQLAADAHCEQDDVGSSIAQQACAGLPGADEDATAGRQWHPPSYMITCSRAHPSQRSCLTLHLVKGTGSA